MKRFAWMSAALLFALVAVAHVPAARAGADISFGMNAPVGDDGHLFFSISSRYFDREPTVVNHWAQRFPNPDDLAVFLHICAEAQVSPDVVFNYRRQGMSWYDVGMRAGLPPAAWSVEPSAYDHGHSKKHGKGSKKYAKLSDREVCDRVAVRMAHEYYGVAPQVAMDWRREGGNVQAMMTREYHERHGRGDNGHHGEKRHDH